MKRLAIVGSRDFPNLPLVKQFVERLQRDTVVVSGGARGVDSVAVEAARQRGLATEVFEADWDRLGKRAGIDRNARMIDTVDGLVAFWDGKSRGTQHAIQCAKTRGIWVRVYVIDGHRDVPLDVLSKVKMPFGQYVGFAFDRIPLSYLDWLSGQPWMEYGWLREALTRYLTHPTIVRELDREIESTDEWGNRLDVHEVFVPSEQTSRHFSLGKPEFIDPEEEAAEERRQQRRVRPPKHYSEIGAWKLAFEILCRMEDPRTQPEQMDALIKRITPALKQQLPERLLNELREAFVKWRARMVTESLYPPCELCTWEERERQKNRRLFCRAKQRIKFNRPAEELVAV